MTWHPVLCKAYLLYIFLLFGDCYEPYQIVCPTFFTANILCIGLRALMDAVAL